MAYWRNLKGFISPVYWALALPISYEVGRSEDHFNAGLFWFTLLSAGFVYGVGVAIWRMADDASEQP